MRSDIKSVPFFSFLHKAHFREGTRHKKAFYCQLVRSADSVKIRIKRLKIHFVTHARGMPSADFHAWINCDSS